MVDPLREGAADEARALLLLDALPGVGPIRVVRLVARFGSARAALRSPGSAFAAVAGEAAREARGDPALAESVERSLARARALGMTLRTWGDPAYPARLRRLADPPPVLFLRGRDELAETPGVAVVGARRATFRGRDVARRLGRALGEAGIPVVSGLALGVDGAAHAGALDVGGPTVAVMGTGADVAYPRSHAALFRKVVRHGLVVSEFLPGTKAHPHHFPRRNRVLAGLAHTVVVVEAGRKSGALITVDHALDLGLDVAAVPGPIDATTCAGSNALLREGAEALVSVEAFVEALVRDRGAPPARRPAGGEGPAPAALDAESAAVLACLAGEGAGVEAVARATGLPPGRALALLTRLELQGAARRLPGPRFRRAG